MKKNKQKQTGQTQRSATEANIVKLGKKKTTGGRGQRKENPVKPSKTQ